MVQSIGIVQKKVDAHLILAGDFSSDSLKGEIKNIEGVNNVEYKGFLSRKELAELLGHVKAGLVLFHPAPNHIHAQPNKMFEYMSAGIPAIGSDFPLWREIIEGEDCGICVDLFNLEEIAGAIRWIIEHPAEAERMGKNGRRAAEERYNWSIEEKKLIEFYEKPMKATGK